MKLFKNIENPNWRKFALICTSFLCVIVVYMSWAIVTAIRKYKTEFRTITADISRARSKYWNDDSKLAVHAIAVRGNNDEMSDLVLCCLEEGEIYPVKQLFEEGILVSNLSVSELDLFNADPPTSEVVRRKMCEERCALLPWNWTTSRWRDVKPDDYP